MNYIHIITALFTLIVGHDLYYWHDKKQSYPRIMQQRAEALARNPFLLKFTSLNEEVVIPSLEVQGAIPQWLEGTLIRNGAGKFETSTQTVSHPFDGFAMLHAFSFNNGNVSYANKFLESNYYKKAKTTGIIDKGFSANPDKLIFKKFLSYFLLQSNKKQYEKHDNANVNVAKIAQKFVALTETSLFVTFDSQTLATNSHLIFEDDIKGHVSTAHPLTDAETEETFNYLTQFGRESFYHIYSLPCNSKTRKLIASIPVENPSYMHSFSITKNYVILTEIPFRVSPLTLLFSTKPFIQNFVWKPEEGTIFMVINRKDGSIIGRFKGEPFFTFHHVNAFEQNNSIVMDIITYDDASKIGNLSFDRIFNQTNQTVTKNQLKRFTINTQTGIITSKTIMDSYAIEMPQINNAYALQPYHYVYTLNNNGSGLSKINVQNGATIKWEEDNCSVSEPVFVSAPNAQDEDEGVVLSIILDSKAKRSFLLILDGKTFKEIGRAMVPHHIPFNLHGAFFKH